MSNLKDFARQELEAAGFPMSISGIPPDANHLDELNAYDTAKCVLQLLETLSQQGHSGGSIGPVISLFNSLAQYKPLTPLQGTDNEWFDCTEMSSRPMWQNKRCHHVFKDADGRAYDLDAIVYVEPNGCKYTKGIDERHYITFPYTPTIQYIHVDENGEPFKKDHK